VKGIPFEVFHETKCRSFLKKIIYRINLLSSVRKCFDGMIAERYLAFKNLL